MTSDLAKSPLYKHTMRRLEEAKRVNSQGNDFWMAREIHALFGYPVWDKFEPVIDRAAASITAQGGDSSHHIAQTSKMVGLGDGAKRRVREYFLSRGACYLIAMNGDPSKAEIAGAQAYFAIQARRSELRDNELADLRRLSVRDRVTAAFKRVTNVAHDAGVRRFGLFNHQRFLGLYGVSRKEIEQKKGLLEGEEFLDRAGALELAAHEFQMQLAASKIVNESISGEERCLSANLAVARDVRRTVLDQSGRELSDAPLEQENIKSLRKRLSPSRKSKGDLPSS